MYTVRTPAGKRVVYDMYHVSGSILMDAGETAEMAVRRTIAELRRTAADATRRADRLESILAITHEA